jgi:hypothetical protein
MHCHDTILYRLEVFVMRGIREWNVGGSSIKLGGAHPAKGWVLATQSGGCEMSIAHLSVPKKIAHSDLEHSTKPIES